MNIEENVIALRTLMDEEIALNWATGNKISYDSMEKLFKESFISMEALELIDSDDLAKNQNSKGPTKTDSGKCRKTFKFKSQQDRRPSAEKQQQCQ